MVYDLLVSDYNALDCITVNAINVNYAIYDVFDLVSSVATLVTLD